MKMESNGIFEQYFEELSTSDNKGLLLAKFYCQLFELTITPNTIRMFNKLLKEFTVYNIFYSISDMFSMNEVNHTNIYGLVKYFCKARVNKEEIKMPERLTIESMVTKIEKSSTRKLKVKNPFEENNV
jgi:hypothetical protein